MTIWFLLWVRTIGSYVYLVQSRSDHVWNRVGLTIVRTLDVWLKTTMQNTPISCRRSKGIRQNKNRFKKILSGHNEVEKQLERAAIELHRQHPPHDAAWENRVFSTERGPNGNRTGDQRTCIIAHHPPPYQPHTQPKPLKPYHPHPLKNGYLHISTKIQYRSAGRNKDDRL